MNTTQTHSRKALRQFENVHQFTKFCSTCKLVTVWETFTAVDVGTALEFCTAHEDED